MPHPREGLVVRACQSVAARFRRGGTLFAFGDGTAAADAAHIAVEFVHPVVVGKPALPAVSLSGGAGHGSSEAYAFRLASLAGPRDIALGLSFGECASVRRGLEAARGRGALTVALTGGSGPSGPAIADHVLAVASNDPRVVRETHVTVYHVLWELVHVLLEHPGPLEREVSA